MMSYNVSDNSEQGRRRVWLVNPRFQLRFLAYMSVVSVLTIAIVYCANLYFFAALRKTGHALNLPPDHVFFDFVRSQAHTMNYIFLFTSLIVLLTIAISGLILSHRVAGPLFRLYKHMEAVADGRTTSLVKFRKKDFFPEIAEAYNRQLDFLIEKSSRKGD